MTVYSKEHDNHIRAIVYDMLSRQGQPRWAIVDQVNPNDATAKVRLMPEMAAETGTNGKPYLTGWLPIKCLAAGPVNIMALPTSGDQVLVLPDCGDAEHGIIAMAAHGGATLLPVSPATGLPAQSGEVLIEIGGLYFHMANGKIYLGGGDVVVNGNITATGNVTAGEGGSSVELLHHAHQDSGGTGNGGPPVAGS